MLNLSIVIPVHNEQENIQILYKELKPVLTICGHLHETFNKQDKLGKSIIINPGPEGQLIEI